MIEMNDFDELRNLIEGEASLPGTSAPRAAETPPAMNSAETLPAKLESLTHRALEQSDKIFDLPLDQADAQFGSVLRAKTACITSTLSAKVRVDEGVLRQPRRDDTVLKLLRAKIDHEETKMKDAGIYREGNPEADARELARLKAVGLIPPDYGEFTQSET